MPLPKIDYNKINYEPNVHLLAVGPLLSHSDLAPLLDELSVRFHSVESLVFSSEPPAAGMSEIALGISLAATVPVGIYMKGFFGSLGRRRR